MASSAHLRSARVLAVLAAALLCTGATAQAAAPPVPDAAPPLARAGQALLASHLDAPGGWSWRSVLQAPHLQTDRDVGAAGVLVGLLALHDATGRADYLDAARRAGDWLLGAAQPGRPGLTWPDYHDPGHVSATQLTSFDDGAPGIADALWRLGQATGDRRYRAAAVAGMRWLAAQAESTGAGPCPRVACRFDYFDYANEYRSGIGEGNAGIAYAFDLFALRTGDRGFERYALATARYLETRMTATGAIAERELGRPTYETGFLAGAAGDAYAFLELYTHTHQDRFRRDAERLLAYVARQTDRRPEGVAWPIEGEGTSSPDDTLATGFEEGAAGIGWVELQAWRVTGRRDHLALAHGAGDWLLSLAPHAQLAGWPEDDRAAIFHTGLDNGAAGIGWFLYDLALAPGGARFRLGATRALQWLAHVLGPEVTAPWPENIDAQGRHLPGDPSWHWGAAGIAAFAARAHGGSIDMPGEEPALPLAATARRVLHGAASRRAQSRSADRLRS